MTLEYHLGEFIKDPLNPAKNFNLGLLYDINGHTASAISFYLRCAEYSYDNDLTYESLLRLATCLGKQSRRINSERGVYLHAISLIPDRPEAYFLLSQHYERLKEWLECYTMANLAEFYKNNSQPTYTDISYPGEYGPTFQKAISSWWVGQFEESKKLFYKLADEYGEGMLDDYKNSVINNINALGLYNHPHLKYTPTQQNNLKYQFKGVENIQENYSQAYQDIFVLTMLNGKKNGTYLEIGAGDAFYGSNTALLDLQFGWGGISIEYNSNYIENFKQNRTSILINEDATQINYTNLLKTNNFPTNIDYLQLDCDPPEITYNILLKIPFEEYKFAVITYEHDYYTDPNRNSCISCTYREKSREFLISKGYELIINNVAADKLCSFEDWWVHPDLVDKEIIDKIKFISDKTKKSTTCIFK
jgi:hypothetical protein